MVVVVELPDVAAIEAGQEAEGGQQEVCLDFGESVFTTRAIG